MDRNKQKFGPWFLRDVPLDDTEDKVSYQRRILLKRGVARWHSKSLLTTDLLGSKVEARNWPAMD